MTLTFGSLFAGVGGFDLGFERAGMRCAWQVERDPYCLRVLAKHWPDVPRFDDVRTFPPDPFTLPPVDVICGGFPCQDVSNAGKRAGIDGERSGLWREYARIIGALRPRFVVVENVPGLLVRGLGRVLGDLAALGYDAEWSDLSACRMGAPQMRERVFVVAHRHEIGWRSPRLGDERPDAMEIRFDAWQAAPGWEWRDVERWAVEVMGAGNGIAPPSERRGMVDGVPGRLDRIGAVGNAVVPQVAEWIGRRLVEVA